ncbi:hypothetical protein HHK36_032682 [Tetracentron sinense]|uniref:Uncharacterized protein n=1 Tax=Tetracentron sinense TaxID=13715 RepID=A0A834Y7N4_TETSI|nr:hypothetical protein HHK36_032682 [Tetracentron sinense]
MDVHLCPYFLSVTDTVLELLRNYGFTNTQIAKVITKYPPVLFANPNKNLKPKMEFLRNNGISDPIIAKMLSADSNILKRSLEKRIIPSFNYIKSFLRTNDNIAIAFGRSTWIFHNLRKQNIRILQNHGVPDSIISKILMTNPRTLCADSDKFSEAVMKIIEMGFDPSSLMFVRGLWRLLGINKGIWEVKLSVYRSFGWSDAEILSMFRKQPGCMASSEKKISTGLDFFMDKLNFTRADIFKYPTYLFLSLEKRTMPRCSVFEVLLSKGLMKKGNMGKALKVAEDEFMNKYVVKYQEDLPQLLKVYQNSREEKLFAGFQINFRSAFTQIWKNAQVFDSIGDPCLMWEAQAGTPRGTYYQAVGFMENVPATNVPRGRSPSRPPDPSLSYAQALRGSIGSGMDSSSSFVMEANILDAKNLSTEVTPYPFGVFNREAESDYLAVWVKELCYVKVGIRKTNPKGLWKSGSQGKSEQSKDVVRNNLVLDIAPQEDMVLNRNNGNTRIWVAKAFGSTRNNDSQTPANLLPKETRHDNQMGNMEVETNDNPEAIQASVVNAIEELREEVVEVEEGSLSPLGPLVDTRDVNWAVAGNQTPTEDVIMESVREDSHTWMIKNWLIVMGGCSRLNQKIREEVLAISQVQNPLTDLKSWRTLLIQPIKWNQALLLVKTIAWAQIIFLLSIKACLMLSFRQNLVGSLNLTNMS